MKWKMIHIDQDNNKTFRLGRNGTHLKSIARKMYIEYGCTVNFTIYDPSGSFWQRCSKVDSANRLIWSWR